MPSKAVKFYVFPGLPASHKTQGERAAPRREVTDGRRRAIPGRSRHRWRRRIHHPDTRRELQLWRPPQR
jgi:hypothetical protein